jgi:hypothetical protein
MMFFSVTAVCESSAIAIIDEREHKFMKTDGLKKSLFAIKIGTSVLKLKPLFSAFS